MSMRNSSSPATILAVKQAFENNRTVTLLTPQEGIVYATLFGGPKSKLRSLVSPFNCGTAFLYKDETKKSCKLTDFDVKSYHPSFRENLFKTYAANFACEIVIKSRCAGSPDQAFYLLNGLLDGMELSNENNSRLGLIRFLWRYLAVLGVRPDAQVCCQCGKSFLEKSFNSPDFSGYGLYSEGDNGFICEDCIPKGSIKNLNTFTLSKKSLTYLQAISVLKPKEVRQIIITQNELSELRDFCYMLIQNACNTKFLSLESGISIL